jgi:hypothetical protein
MNGMFTTASRELASGMGVVLLIAALGVALALRGWRSRIPDMDLIPDILSAHALLERGRIPDRGVVSSYASYVPPGQVWIVLPGVLLLSDPRVYDLLGVWSLYLGTLIGIFLLARAYFGMRCALLSVVFYGVSKCGLLFTGGGGYFGPRGHPFFYIWMVYWTSRWVARSDGRYLAAALLTWAAGMYVHMELAPAVFILPVVWYFYRPPVRLRALAVVGALALLMWYPYLRFETMRHFADLRSQVLLQSLQPANYWEAWCDPTLTLREWGRPFIEPLVSGTLGSESFTTRFVMALGRRGLAIARGLVFNFEGLVPGTEFVLLGLVMGGLFLLSFPQGRGSLEGFEATARLDFRQQWLTFFGMGLLVCGVLANEFVIGRYLAPNGTLVSYTVSTIRIFQVMVALCGIVLLMRVPIARALKTLAIRLHPAQADTRPLVLSLAVPWLILLLAAEHGRPERLFWLWPVQVVILAVCFARVRSRISAVRRVLKIGGALIVCTLAGTAVLPAFQSKNGWSGPDAAEVQVVDYVANLLHASGRARAAIGYRFFTDDWVPRFAAVDPRYKVGAAVDLLFKDLHGVSNADDCAEGVAPDDEYRIVQSEPLSDGPDHYFVFPPDKSFRFLHQFGKYDVYKRE